ncbi:MAG: hypothetical protein WCJ09_18835 [Planctomycetota bacterium]
MLQITLQIGNVAGHDHSVDRNFSRPIIDSQFVANEKTNAQQEEFFIIRDNFCVAHLRPFIEHSFQNEELFDAQFSLRASADPGSELGQLHSMYAHTTVRL